MRNNFANTIDTIAANTVHRCRPQKRPTKSVRSNVRQRSPTSTVVPMSSAWPSTRYTLSISRQNVGQSTQSRSTCTVDWHPNGRDSNSNYRISGDANCWRKNWRQQQQRRQWGLHCNRRLDWHSVRSAGIVSALISFAPHEFRYLCNRACAISVSWAICLISLMPKHWLCWNSRVDIPESEAKIN